MGPSVRPTGGFVRPVSAEEVELGAPLAWSVYDRAGKLLFVQGMVLACQAHLDIVLERGMVVPETATSGGAMVPPLHPPGRAAGDDEAAGDDLDEEEPGEPEPPVFRAMQQLRRELHGLHAGLLGAESEDLGEQARWLALRLQSLVARDADAALAAMQLEVGDDGEIARVLHAATLCQVLVQALQWEADEGLSVLAAALTYDVALGPVSTVLNRQTGALTPDQRAMIDTHPEAGVELLQAAGVDDEVWLEAVLQHHERLDGSGYPAGLAGEAISRGARMLAIVDIYSAMVRPRAYREAIHARHALRSLFLERGKAVDERLATLLVREIGVFPPGTPVRLANHEVGVVLRRGSDAARPVVARLINANGTLAAIAAQRDTSLPQFAITETVPPTKYQALVASASELWCSDLGRLRP
jgi:hypothetical protein